MSTALNPDPTAEMHEEAHERKKELRIKHEVAEDPNTPLETLKTLLADDDIILRHTVYQHPSLTPQFLDEAFEKEEGHSNLMAIVAHTNASTALLEKVFRRCPMLFDPDAEDIDALRGVAAGHDNATPFILEEGIKDVSVGVRCAVAENPKTPQEFLMLAAEDGERDVRFAVAGNPNAAAGILLKTIGDEDRDVRHGAAANPNTPADALYGAAFDTDKWVREGVAENESAPREALLALLLDEDESVRRVAVENWKSRGFDQAQDTALPPPAVPPTRSMRL